MNLAVPETSQFDYVLTIRQPLFSKARPRLTKSGHAYMPKEYRAAQEEMKRQLREQWGDRPMLSGPLALKITVKGEGRGDLDNIAGALMDSGHNILWDEDRVSVISELSISWTRAPKKDSEWVVQIKNLWVP